MPRAVSLWKKRRHNHHNRLKHDLEQFATMEPLHHNLADNMRGSGYSSKFNPLMRSAVFVVVALLLRPVYGWRSGSSYSIYGDSLNRDWIASSSVSLEVNGCVWAQVADTDDGECLERSSEDGTVYWYKMANCRRPQVAFSLYADDGSNAANCNSKNFKETVSEQCLLLVIVAVV